MSVLLKKPSKIDSWTHLKSYGTPTMKLWISGTKPQDPGDTLPALSLSLTETFLSTGSKNSYKKESAVSRVILRPLGS